MDNNLDVDPQNIQNMGGLRKKMPFTFVVALIASLALIGLPFTVRLLIERRYTHTSLRLGRR